MRGIAGEQDRERKRKREREVIYTYREGGSDEIRVKG